MPDLSKHLARAKQAYEKGSCDLALETLNECVEVDPTQIEIYKILLPAARRRAKEGGKAGLLDGLGGLTGLIGKDPHKAFCAAIKRLGRNPDAKVIADAAEAAQKMAQSGVKPMIEVAIHLYEEFRASKLFSEKVLWNLANLHKEKAKSGDLGSLDMAIKVLHELDRHMPNHIEAGRTLKNWEAERSMRMRQGGGQPGAAAKQDDYRGQLASDAGARKAEVMNRNIRTAEDANEVLKYLDEDLAASPDDKALWIKKGEALRRVGQLAGTRADLDRALAAARAAFEQAQRIDVHDFTVTMKLGDIAIAEAKANADALPAGSPEQVQARKALLELEIAEYRRRVERQPTDSGHRYNLGTRLLQAGQVEAAAGEFQRTVADPRLRRPSHRWLGYCFAKKNLLDLAVQHYSSFLSLVDDEMSDEAKEVRYQLARTYEDQGKTADAVAQYERLVSLDLNFKDAATRLTRLRGG